MAPQARLTLFSFVARRLLQSLGVLLGVSVIVFALLHLTGDPTRLLLPLEAREEDVRQLLGLLLIMVFAVGLGWFPAAGRDGLASLVLPATALGAFSMARIARMARSGMLEVLAQDYVRTARAAGIRAFLVTYKYALKNAAIPLVTIVGLEFGILLGGAVITETIFAWPGVGRLAVDAIFSRDYPLVQAIVA